MITISQELALFPFIQPGHRFYPQIEAWRAMIDEHPEYEQWCERMSGSERSIIHAEIKGAPTANGWSLDQFSWSFQYWDISQVCQFQATTLNYTANSGHAVWSHFPTDPCLQSVDTFFRQQCQPGGVLRCNVLRYTPLQQLTFRVSPLLGNAALMIGKFKRHSHYAQAYEQLESVARSVQRSEVSFTVAAPLGVDHTRCLYFQEAKPGQQLTTLIDKEHALSILERVGEVHQELHTLDVPDAPVWQFDSMLLNLQRNINWISFFRPDQLRVLQAIQILLLQHVPDADPDSYVFCHGDFRCPQILSLGDSWSITDFDLGLCGDVYREIATFQTSLRYDLPLFQEPRNAVLYEDASAAYLDGYQQQAGRSLDIKRLYWYRICAEITYLALMFRHNWYTPGLFAEALEHIQQLSGQLQRGSGIKW